MTEANEGLVDSSFEELHTDDRGKTFVREEIGDLFVQYTYFDEDGTPHPTRPFPRIQIFPDAVNEESDKKEIAAQES